MAPKLREGYDSFARLSCGFADSLVCRAEWGPQGSAQA